jgi:F0F1-type ATP synthase gamma subunit
LIHYNEKYAKCENYFSNIKNIEKDTSNPMELFFECLVEFKKVKEILNLDKYENTNGDEKCMDYYFEENEDENIDNMMKLFSEGQIYCLDFNQKRILSPSILVCLNYLINNKKNLFEDKGWNIFNLRDN